MRRRIILRLWLQASILRLLHEKEWEQHLKHALTVVHVVREAVELDDALRVLEQPRRVFQDGRTGDVICHFVSEAPLLLDTFLLGPEALHILLHLFAKEDLLQADQCAVLERKLLVVEHSVEVLTELSLLELDQRVAVLLFGIPASKF